MTEFVSLKNKQIQNSKYQIHQEFFVVDASSPIEWSTWYLQGRLISIELETPSSYFSS